MPIDINKEQRTSQKFIRRSRIPYAHLETNPQICIQIHSSIIMRQDKLHGLRSICFTRSRSLHPDPAVTKGTSTHPTRSHAKKQLKTPKLNREQQRTYQKHGKGTIMRRPNFFPLTSDFPATSLNPRDHFQPFLTVSVRTPG